MSTKQDTLSTAILKHGPEILDHCLLEGLESYVERVAEEYLDYPLPKEQLDTDNWFMPESYKTYDLITFLNHRVAEETGFPMSDLRYRDTPEYARKELELAEFQKRKLIPLLRQMKYIVDTLKENNIVWGVGRGSSVASYILYLLNVHRINSIKYNIDITEFFKGDENGT